MFGVIVALALLVIAIVVTIVFTTNIEKILGECGYLKSSELQTRASLARGFELYVQIEFTRWLSDEEIRRFSVVAEHFDATIEEGFVTALYSYDNQALTFVFYDLRKAEKALNFFRKHCHAIG